MGAPGRCVAQVSNARLAALPRNRVRLPINHAAQQHPQACSTTYTAKNVVHYTRHFQCVGTAVAMASTAQQLEPRALEALSLLLLLLLGLGGPMRAAEAQQVGGTCAAQLSELAPCARYSVPPAPGQALQAPGPECCSALGAVSRDCACGTLDIINSLPAKCGLPRVTCQ